MFLDLDEIKSVIATRLSTRTVRDTTSMASAWAQSNEAAPNAMTVLENSAITMLWPSNFSPG